MRKPLPFILSSITVAILAGCATGTESCITSVPAPAPAAAAPAPAPTTYVVAPAGTILVPSNAAPAGAPVGTTAGTILVPQTATPAPVAAALRPGFGRIESVQILPAAAAGGAASSSNKRITMRMDDGTVQYFTTHAGVAVGARIEITSNGTMRHPALVL